MAEPIKIRYTTIPGERSIVVAPLKKYPNDAGWDLTTSQSTIIPAGHSKDVSTDIRISIPDGYYARIVGRSSTLRRHGVLVVEGIIDSGYTGELFVCIRNMTKKDFYAQRGTRYAQVLFYKVENIEWARVPASKFKDKERGSHGFGSTGG